MVDWCTAHALSDFRGAQYCRLPLNWTWHKFCLVCTQYHHVSSSETRSQNRLSSFLPSIAELKKVHGPDKTRFDCACCFKDKEGRDSDGTPIEMLSGFQCGRRSPNHAVRPEWPQRGSAAGRRKTSLARTAIARPRFVMPTPCHSLQRPRERALVVHQT